MIDEILSGNYRKGSEIPGWDGQAACRVVRELARFLKVTNVLSRLSETNRPFPVGTGLVALSPLMAILALIVRCASARPSCFGRRESVSEKAISVL